GSTANLSLVCALSQRILEVFDSFQGLPEPSAQDRSHKLLGVSEIHTYQKGSWAGTLEEVKGNIARFGQISVVRFNQGYFDQTLPHFSGKCAFAFLDVDLVDSLETCVRWLWPLMADGGYVFTHEAPHYEIASFFYDKEWWQVNLGCDPPGLVGAGNGLGLFAGTGGFHSDIGYTIKNPAGAHIRPQIGLEPAMEALDKQGPAKEPAKEEVKYERAV
ncbi:MAG TPA: TylF/MycF/NovP-related O-methyltransferase, partial [Blastocatellia bacterium]|nr:TylF/MycF/NovP-related O-methyltransferase [Blastocatellia bacterium]